MVYIYKKIVGGKEYYYLRASVRRGSRVVTKDIAYLGNDPHKLKEKLSQLPSEHSKEIRKAYKTINRFVEVNHYLQKIRSMKLKKDDYLSKDKLEQVEACRLHWLESFQKIDELTKKEVFNHFIVEFAFNTTSIEGNTITLEEAHKLLVDKLTPKNKTLREIYDLQNTEKVFFSLLGAGKKISTELVCNVHDSLLENIDARKGYRTMDVKVFKAQFKSTPAPYVLTDMGLLVKWYEKNENLLHPLALASIFHHKFEKIHPFMDGNGRTGRMMLNYILMKAGYPPLIITKKLRSEYLENLRYADESDLNDAKPSVYKELVEFSADELVSSYWSIFL